MFRRAGPALALKKFEVDELRRTVHVSGRAPGLMSWLLARLGLDSTTTLECDATQVTFQQSSLYGQTTTGVAMPAVASVTAGYSKPLGRLIFGGLLAAGGLFGAANMALLDSDAGAAAPLAVGLILGLACGIQYVLSKTIVLSVETSGGARFGLTFKRSVIEGVAVDVDKARQAMGLINDNVVQAYQASEARPVG